MAETWTALAFGYRVKLEQLKKRFGTRAVDGVQRYGFEGRELDSAHDLMDRISARLSAQYCLEGSLVTSYEPDFAFTVPIEDTTTLEELMRKDDAAHELGRQLREMGLDVADVPLVMVCTVTM